MVKDLLRNTNKGTCYSKFWLFCQAFPHSYKGYNKWVANALKA
ncbi:hypothetical protein HMPREF1432_01393 [Helicobacter pylori GAMchJs114i]|nr:hypothetical protein HMPREF1432_01393 [Helicobacter pylori GAMchJs114i]